jgi:hypothetical protein
VAAAKLLAVAHGAGAAHAQEGLSKKRQKKNHGIIERNVSLSGDAVQRFTAPELGANAEGPGRAKTEGTPAKPTYDKDGTLVRQHVTRK